MKKPLEIIQGDKSLRLNFYLIIASYLMLFVVIEPAIDFLLLFIFEQKTLVMIEQLDYLKLISSSLIYSILGILPSAFMAWFGYRVVASSKLPPVLTSGQTRFPFTVLVIKGRIAKMFGVLIIITALVLIFQLILHFINTLLL